MRRSLIPTAPVRGMAGQAQPCACSGERPNLHRSCACLRVVNNGGQTYSDTHSTGQHLRMPPWRGIRGTGPPDRPVPQYLWRRSTRPRNHDVLGPAHSGPIYRVSVDDWAIDVCPHHGPSSHGETTAHITSHGSPTAAFARASSTRALPIKAGRSPSRSRLDRLTEIHHGHLSLLRPARFGLPGKV